MSTVTEPTSAWCVEREHPFVTYNPHLDRTFCRCGQRQQPGEAEQDMRAKWQVFHDHEPGESCRCYSPKEPESRTGQTDLFDDLGAA